MTLLTLLVAVLWLGTLGFLAALLLGGLLWIRETLFSGNPPSNDEDDGWRGDVDPIYPIAPICPEEEKEDCTCV